MRGSTCWQLCSFISLSPVCRIWGVWQPSFIVFSLSLSVQAGSVSGEITFSKVLQISCVCHRDLFHLALRLNPARYFFFWYIKFHRSTGSPVCLCTIDDCFQDTATDRRTCIRDGMPAKLKLFTVALYRTKFADHWHRVENKQKLKKKKKTQAWVGYKRSTTWG